MHIGAVEVLIDQDCLIDKMFGRTSTLLYEKIHVSGGGKIGACTWKLHMPFSCIVHKLKQVKEGKVKAKWRAQNAGGWGMGHIISINFTLTAHTLLLICLFASLAMKPRQDSMLRNIYAYPRQLELMENAICKLHLQLFISINGNLFQWIKQLPISSTLYV